MIKKIIYTDNSDPLLKSFFRDISKYKILTNEEIVSLIGAFRKTGDIKLRDKIVTSNLRFVVTIAKQYLNRGVPLLDLISAGSEGLIEAIDKFDNSKNVTFISYAVWWIRQRMFYIIYNTGYGIRLPMNQRRNIIAITKASYKFTAEHHRNASSKELSEITGIPEEIINELAKFANKIQSTDTPLGESDEDGTIGDTIADNQILPDESTDKACVKDELSTMLSKLPVREHDILCMWFGIGMPTVDPTVIADMYGVCGERVRQLKETALARLKKKFSNNLKRLL